MSSAAPHRLFISHAADDLGQAEELAALLAAAGNLEVLLSRDSVETGEDYDRASISPIKEADAVVLLLSGASPTSPTFRADLNLAADTGKPLLPVMLTGDSFYRAHIPKGWYYWLDSSQAIPWTDAESVASSVRGWLAGPQSHDAGEPAKPIVFLSHSSGDRKQAAALADRLNRSDQVRVWHGERDIRLAEDYSTAIARAVRGCDAFVVLVSDSAMASDHVRREVGLALRFHKTFLPVALDPGAIRVDELPDQWMYWLSETPTLPWTDPETVADQLLLRVSPPAQPDEPPEPEGSSVGPPPREDRYGLHQDPDGSSWTARENLTEILRRELLGPLGGDAEVLPVDPATAYPLGRIAPRRLATPDAPAAEEAEVDTEAGEDDAARSLRDDDAGADDEGGEDAAPKRGLMIPASMGLRFQIRIDLASFTVRASWGTYRSRNVEGSEGERKRREFVRTPVDVPVVVEVADLKEGTTKDFPLQDDAVLRVDVYSDTDHRLIEVALCNDAEPAGRIPVDAWLFQATLYVEADGKPVFLPVRDALVDARPDEGDGELARLRLQYRNRLEFAIGRTCSATWQVAEGERRATKVWTTWLPVSETPQTQAESNDAVITDMRALATASVEELRAGLEPITAGYAAWLDAQEAEAKQLPEHLRQEGLDAVAEARRVAKRLAEGIEFLLSDAEALRCFRFMNQVMADQRVHSEIVLRRSRDKSLDVDAATALVAAAGARAHSWRMFQLAFVLMQLPALCDPTHKYRSEPDLARVELLFFPTGGGKTEAYLGLAAFAFAIRRRQGVVASADGPLDGGAGLAVLMRYTLRLLTAQQFQRASTMVCAAELARREDEATWGAEPFRIGLWVGTNVSPKRVKEAAEQLKAANDSHYDHGLTVLQVKRCPWCGTPITKQQVKVDTTIGRVFVRCGDPFGDCPFAEGGLVDEGLPILTVDEEIYRLAPAFVIATVDKFARLAREGEAASLFGYVAKRCDRHGYVHPDYPGCDILDGSRHPAKDGHPAAAARPCGRLRPPDLIIQDELHLITGALGTTVGLFEAAIDTLTSWTTADERPVSPLIVASSATVRNAPEQVRALYGRQVAIFPPQVLDAADTHFSRELPISREHPGRRYVGVCASGVRLTAAEIRLAEVLLAAGQALLDADPDAADPYLTLVAYFNATRELAGMARFMQDDVQTALGRGRPWSRLPSRRGTAFGTLSVAELTSRVSSSAITTTLDQLAVPFDPAFDTTGARSARVQAAKAGQPPPEREQVPFDAVLATSMLQVGVDVPRLGLMLLVGQPKNTAEYIQASSRVGRSADGPGLVVTLGNWARPRDLAHFEQFRHYHETFYAQVEALSVTPYSVTAIERGLDGVLVSAARVLAAAQGATGLSPEAGAEQVEAEAALLDALVTRLQARALAASGEERTAKLVRERLVNRVDQWKKRRTALHQESKTLVYERVKKGSGQGPLMIGAEASTTRDLLDGAPFVVPNSMREVQPEINLLVSPDPKRLFQKPPANQPDWVFPTEEDD